MNKKVLLLLLPFAVGTLAGCDPAKPNPPVDQCDQAQVTLNKTTATLRVGESVELVATAPEACSNLGWGVDQAGESVVSLQKDGKTCTVTATSVGTAIVGYGTTASCTITVEDGPGPVIHVESIRIADLYPKMKVGDPDKQIDVTVTPENADNQKILFESKNTAIATVSDAGLMHAIAPGDVDIVVTSEDNPEATKTVKLTVSAADVQIPAKTVGGFTRLDSGELEDGSTIEMISQAGGKIYGMKKYASGNNIPGAELTVADEKIKETADVHAYKVVKNADGSFSFKDGDNKYLYAAGGSEKNNLKSKATLDDTCKFTVSISNGLASIVCKDSATSRGTMCFNENSGNPIFNCYTSAEKYNLISFFVKDQGEQKEIDHIAIEGTLAKTTYNEGDSYSSDGLKVIAYYKDSTHGEVVAAITPSKPTAEVGDTSITFSATYETFNASTDPITVTVQAAQPIPVETEYILTAGSLGLGSYADGKKNGIAWTMLMKGESDSIQGNSSKSSKIWNTSPFSKKIEKVTLTVVKDSASSTGSLKIGDQTISLGKETSYPFATATPIVIEPTSESNKFEFTFTGGAVYFASIKFEFAAEEKVLTKIEVQTPPSKNEYYQGDTLNTAGMVVMGTYEGEATPVDVTSKVTVSPTVLNTIGDSIVITVSLDDKSDTFNVKVSAVPAIQSLTINADDMNKDYKDGETISLEGVKVYANYEGGDSALLASDKYTLSCNPTAADIDTKTTKLTASLVDTSAGVPDATLDVTLNVSEFVVFEKATDIVVGDIVALVNEDAKKEMTSVSDIGVVSDYTDYIAHSFELEVVAGSQANTFAFKNGDKYLNFTGSGNKLYLTAEAVTDESSWTVEFNGGNVTIKNVAASTRFIQYNSSQPRFACYTSAQKSVQLYKAPADPAVLQELEVATADHREFYLNDKFVPETIMAKYDKGEDKDVTALCEFSRYDMSVSGKQSVDVSYTENGVTKTASYGITVLTIPAPKIESISINADNMLTEYYDGDDIDLSGVEVYAEYESGDPVKLDEDKYSLVCNPEKADIDSQKTTLTATLLDSEAGVEPATLDVNLTVTAKTLETTLDFTKIEGFGDWTNSYSQHVVEYEDVIVTFDGASKQGATITDRPVGKDAPVTIVAKEGKNLEYFSAEFAKWNTNNQTVNVQYSTDYGAIFVDLGVSTTTFAIAKTNLPKGTSAIRFNPVNTTQMGYTNVITNVIAAQEPDPVAVTGVSLDNEELTIAPTKTEQLVATIAPANATNKNVVWSVIEGEEYVSVDQTGLVTGLKVGEGVVQVETLDGGFKATCAVTVSDDAPTTKEATLDLTGTKTSWDPLTVAKGESATYTVGEFEFSAFGGTASNACTANYSESYRTYSGSYIEISLPSDSKYASFASMTMNVGSKSGSDSGGYKISASTIDDVTGTIKAAASSPAAVVVSDLKGATVIRVSCTSGQLRYVSFNFVMNLK